MSGGHSYSVVILLSYTKGKIISLNNIRCKMMEGGWYGTVWCHVTQCHVTQCGQGRVDDGRHEKHLYCHFYYLWGACPPVSPPPHFLCLWRCYSTVVWPYSGVTVLQRDFTVVWWHCSTRVTKSEKGGNYIFSYRSGQMTFLALIFKSCYRTVWYIMCSDVFLISKMGNAC